MLQSPRNYQQSSTQVLIHIVFLFIVPFLLQTEVNSSFISLSELDLLQMASLYIYSTPQEAALYSTTTIHNGGSIEATQVKS